MTTDGPIARRVSIRGVVQGVGFRPFVYRVALEYGVVGWVINDRRGVEIHAEAAPAAMSAFLDELRRHPPPAASIAHLSVEEAQPTGFTDFSIRASGDEGQPTARISPDLAICVDCLRDLSDRADRRYGYPYINCTHCGPRYSIIQRLPYDRVNTTLAAWTLCPTCRAEYEDPLDRRFHAQPTACALCGPGYALFIPSEQASALEYASREPADCDLADSAPVDNSAAIEPDDAIRRAAELLRDGAIVAIKGIGGYHLACDARSAASISALRTRKFRKEKPFALLARDLDEARQLVTLSPSHEQLLLDRARPIVLAPSRGESPLTSAQLVAPDTDSLGVMLPYTPLHHLLFAAGAPSPLVLTSGNRSSEPIAFRDADARERLAGIADAFLIGERPIARRIDDSVVTVRRRAPCVIRRARGYAPAAVCSLESPQPILALGGDLKNAIALVVEGEAFLSPHIGDLDDAETLAAFEETVADLLAMVAITPQQLIVAHDMHPQFRSTRFAQSLPAARHVAVQHHEAHIASVLAEHQNLEERVLGVAFDGTGYGRDGTIWGGEFFVGSVADGFERVAWLRPARMPGGDAAARFPVQAAAGYLAELQPSPDFNQAPFFFPRRFNDALALVRKDVRCFASSSVGRLFDAVAALVGFTRPITFEGQAAIWLEHLARGAGSPPAYALPNYDAGSLTDTGKLAESEQIIDPRPLIDAVVYDRLSGRPGAQIAAAFHQTLAAAAAAKIASLCTRYKVRTVAVSGGVWQNDLLWDAVAERLADSPEIGLVTNHAAPLNDGGIALGQAAIAARLIGKGSINDT